MKKYLSFLLIIIGMLTFSGCNSSNKAQHPLAIYKGNKIVAEIGMSKEDVDKNLGKGEATPETALFLYNGVLVIYRENAVCSIEVRDAMYSDCKNVKVGMNFSEAQLKYQEGETVLVTNNRAVGIGFDTERQIMNNPVEEGNYLYDNSVVAFMKYYQKADEEKMNNKPSSTKALNTQTTTPDQSNSANNDNTQTDPGIQKISKILILDRDAAFGKY